MSCCTWYRPLRSSQKVMPVSRLRCLLPQQSLNLDFWAEAAARTDFLRRLKITGSTEQLAPFTWGRSFSNAEIPQFEVCPSSGIKVRAIPPEQGCLMSYYNKQSIHFMLTVSTCDYWLCRLGGVGCACYLWLFLLNETRRCFRTV